MKKIQLNRDQMQCLQYNLMSRILKKAKCYQTDFILDLEWLREHNEEIGFNGNDFIYIVRECGTNIGYEGSFDIKYHWVKTNDIYRIHLDKLTEMEVYWCTSLDESVIESLN